MNIRQTNKKDENDIILHEDDLYKSLCKVEESLCLGMLNALQSKAFKLLFETIDIVKAYKFNIPQTARIVSIISENRELLVTSSRDENLLFMLEELKDIQGHELYFQAFSSLEMYGYNLVHIRHYAERFIDLSKKLELRTKAFALIEACKTKSNSSFEVIEQYKQVISEYDVAKDSSNIGDIAKQIENDVICSVSKELVKTGYSNLDWRIEGFQGQEMIILAGRPGTGKSALAMNLALNIARSGKGVLFVSLEMSDKSLTARAISNIACIDGSFYRKNTVEDTAQLSMAVQYLEQMPITILEKCGKITVTKVKEKALKVENLGLIVIDYLQLMKTDERYGSREQEVSAISREIKLMALELGVPVLALAQLNRQVEQTGAEPKASDLRESGGIEQDADIILMLHPKKDCVENDIVPVKCKIVKSRSTSIGTCFFDFKKSHSNFAVGEPWEDVRITKNKNSLF